MLFRELLREQMIASTNADCVMEVLIYDISEWNKTNHFACATSCCSTFFFLNPQDFLFLFSFQQLAIPSTLAFPQRFKA